MSKILIQREKKESIEGRERTTVEEKWYYVADESQNFMTATGMVKKEEFGKPDGSIVKSNSGKEFLMFSGSFRDAFSHIKKLPQTVMPKDIGMIIAMTGIGTDSIVIDAGAGSGALAAGLARVCKHVTTYELRDDFIDNLKENFERLGLKNITLRHKDVTAGVDEKEIDLVTLDMPQPWDAYAAIDPALKIGGFLVCYIPSVPQLMQCVENLPQNFVVIKSLELIERPWIVKGKKVRPDNEMIGHTAFLMFARKIQ